jgi:hypothetical protein
MIMIVIATTTTSSYHQLHHMYYQLHCLDRNFAYPCCLKARITLVQYSIVLNFSHPKRAESVGLASPQNLEREVEGNPCVASSRPIKLGKLIITTRIGASLTGCLYRMLLLFYEVVEVAEVARKTYNTLDKVKRNRLEQTNKRISKHHRIERKRAALASERIVQ